MCRNTQQTFNQTSPAAVKGGGGEKKRMNIITAIQIALQVPGISFLALLALLLAAVQVLRLVSATFALLRLLWSLSARYVVPVWRWQFLAVIGCLSGFLHLVNAQALIVDFLNEAKYRWFQPTYVHEYDNIDDAHLAALYEAQIKSKLDPYEYEVLIRKTAETAAKINSTPLAIYESALLECGLNPFRVRDDKVAAGWIQFTRMGLKGLGVSLEQVIQACERRDIVFIMDLTDSYLVRRWENSGKPDMRNTIDLYLAIFAPAHVQAKPEKVVYAGFSNPAYYKNSGLDGWYQDGGKIIRKESARDGKITVWEIYLCLKARKAALVRSFSG